MWYLILGGVLLVSLTVNLAQYLNAQEREKELEALTRQLYGDEFEPGLGEEHMPHYQTN